VLELTQPTPSHRQRWLIAGLIGIGLLALALIILFVIPPGVNPYAPRYIRKQLPATNSYTWEDYDWFGPVPSHNGKMWVIACPTLRSFRNYLFDFPSHRIVAEVTNCSPVFASEDGSKLLCSVYSSTFQSRLIEQVTGFLVKIHLRRTPSVYSESYAVLDTRNNSTKRVGELLQIKGSGSSWLPSPTFRYGYNRPSAAWANNTGFYVCDLETAEFKNLNPGDPVGWWDAENILISSAPNTLMLCNVTTGNTTNLFTAAHINSFLKKNSLSNATVTTFTKWNGSGYDTYLAPSDQRNWGKGFLLKVNHTNHSLSIVDSAFQFRWSGHIDPIDRYYLYSGEFGQPGKGGDGSVMLRDLRDNSVRTLVPPNKSRQYSLCRFDDTGVLYLTNRHIWHIDLNGSNNVPLFRPSQ
jgi:hypothetical protein